MPADLILTGAAVCPIQSAPIRNAAVAIHGDRILAVDSAEAIDAFVGPATRVIRLSPAHTVIPAFNDSHQHLLSYVRSRSRVPLWETTSVAGVLDRLRAEVRRHAPGSWIVAVGHDQGRLAERRHPTLAELDAALPDHPVLIYRACSHVALANSAALARAGITAATPDPPGGRLERDAAGQPTGVLLEAAMALVSRVIEAPAIDWASGLREAAHEYHRRGIVAVGEAALGHVAGLRDLVLVTSLVRGGELGLRMYVMAYGTVAQHMLREGR
ncbi:MAG: amidohydrolase family protein, partial [Chloroflexi bacterium]|nr:amidohydrolase family protein [Chloroflexota bacterium]